MKWEPIESAPKTEWIMLCLGGADWAVGCWKKTFDGGAWVKDEDTEESFSLAPTHWMPLPKLPIKAMFEKVSCSQCGRDFRPGEHGFSHCSDHDQPTHGGSRPGAGRPKSAVRKVNLTVSLPPASKVRIDAKAKANGVSSSELVKRWSDRLK